MNIIDKNKYTFPFDTCEKPTNKFFAQPYSVTINFISTLIVLYFLFKTRTLHGFMLLFSLLIGYQYQQIYVPDGFEKPIKYKFVQMYMRAVLYSVRIYYLKYLTLF